MKNKKILGALAALCMGIILCVSSVFAVTYWYNINNGTNNDYTVSTGKVVELSMTKDAEDANTGLYPGGTVTFKTVTVKAPKWDPATGGVVNPTLPTFNVEITSVAKADGSEDSFASKFKVWVSVNGGAFVDKGVLAAADGTVTNNLYIAENIQAIKDGADFDIVIRLAFDDNAGQEYAENSLTMTVTIVAIVGGVEVDKVHNDNTGVAEDTNTPWTPAP